MKISAQVGQQVLEIEVRRENGRYLVQVDGVRHLVDAHKLEGDFYSILTDGRSFEVSVEPRNDAYHVRHGATEQLVRLTDPGRTAREGDKAPGGPERLVSMMPGKVVRVLVSEGDAVRAGQGILVVEAMKMENEIAASKDGRVSSVAVAAGQSVEGGTLLAVIE